MLRVVFMGTPEFAVQALAEIHSRHEIVGVYSQADKPVGRGLDLRATPVKAKALELGLTVHQPEKLGVPAELERMKALKPDVIVVVAYGKILKKELLEMPPLGCINIHSSLLPRWRGAAPIQWAILGGDAETGVTTMKLVEQLDAGDTLLQARTLISAEETASSLHDRLARMGADLILPTLEGLSSGSLSGQSQDESQVTYATKLTKEMEFLDPQQTSIELDRRVRALNPWPGTSIRLAPDDAAPQRLKIKKAKAHSALKGQPGQLFERAGMLLLGTREGSLQLQVVQWDGKKEVDAAGFMNGLKGRGIALPLGITSGSAMLLA